MMETSVHVGGPGVFEVLIIGCIVLFCIAAAVVQVLAFCTISKKAGLHWALGLIVLVPFGGLIMPLMLAFMKWPALQQLQASQG
jgi:hypothetical protein